MNRSKFLLFLVIGLCLGGCYECAKYYVGDSCKSGNINGKCTLGSECRTHAAFIQHRLLTKEEIKSCGLAVYEEIICCPLDNETNKKLLMESPAYYSDVPGSVATGGFPNTEFNGAAADRNGQLGNGNLALENSGATSDCADTSGNDRLGINAGFANTGNERRDSNTGLIQDTSAFGNNNNNNNNQNFPSAFPSQQGQHINNNNNAANIDDLFNGQPVGESAFPNSNVDNTPKRKLCDPHHKDCIVFRDDEYIKFKVGDWCSFKSYVGTCAARSHCTTLKRLFDAHLVVNEDVSTCGFNVYEEIICCPSY